MCQKSHVDQILVKTVPNELGFYLQVRRESLSFAVDDMQTFQCIRRATEEEGQPREGGAGPE
jgi:hypothetical protein